MCQMDRGDRNGALYKMYEDSDIENDMFEEPVLGENTEILGSIWYCSFHPIQEKSSFWKEEEKFFVW